MTEQEWRDRYAQRMALQTQTTKEDYIECAQAVDDATIDEWRDDPEGCADEELLCWDDDGGGP